MRISLRLELLSPYLTCHPPKAATSLGQPVDELPISRELLRGDYIKFQDGDPFTDQSNRDAA